MGCDIHCYMEYKTEHGWNDFGGRINLGRRYAIFAKMAGVRNYEEVAPVVIPRGYPNDMAIESKCDSRIWISTQSPSRERNCSKEDADRWIANGSSTPVDEKCVTHPDWHTPSWMTTEEFKAAISGFDEETEYYAVLAAMLFFESQGKPARLVFWFDN